MITALKGLVDKVFSSTMKREHVLTEVDVIRTSLRSEVIPSLEITTRNLDGHKLDKKQLEEVGYLMKVMDFDKSKGVTKFLEELTDYIKEINNNLGFLEDMVNSEVPEYITDKTMTARVVAILGTVTNFNSITLFTVDLILYLVYRLSSEDMYYKMKDSMIRLLIPSYAKLYGKYRNNIKHTLTSINKLSDVEIGNVDTFLMSASKNDKKFNLPVNGFIGNPIYYFRMWLVEIEVNKYEYLKDKKRLVELKLLDLQLKSQGEPNPKIHKEIEYYEEKLSGIEYKISKIED